MDYEAHKLYGGPIQAFHFVRPKWWIVFFRNVIFNIAVIRNCFFCNLPLDQLDSHNLKSGKFRNEKKNVHGIQKNVKITNQ